MRYLLDTNVLIEILRGRSASLADRVSAVRSMTWPSHRWVYDVVKGKRSISADTALRLGVYFGLPAQFWLNLQNDYDLRTANVPRLASIKPYKGA